MYIQRRRKELLILRERPIGQEKDIVNRNRRRYLMCIGKLDAMSPLKVMSRGYAIAQGEDKGIIRSVREVNPGDRLLVRVCDGEMISVIEKVREVKDESK